MQTAERLGKRVEELKAIICHLGNGASMACVENGRCVDTTMGLTPLEGLVMGTRCGDLDPGVYTFLARDMKPAEVDRPPAPSWCRLSQPLSGTKSRRFFVLCSTTATGRNPRSVVYSCGESKTVLILGNCPAAGPTRGRRGAPQVDSLLNKSSGLKGISGHSDMQKERPPPRQPARVAVVEQRTKNKETACFSLGWTGWLASARILPLARARKRTENAPTGAHGARPSRWCLRQRRASATPSLRCRSSCRRLPPPPGFLTPFNPPFC